MFYAIGHFTSTRDKDVVMEHVWPVDGDKREEAFANAQRTKGLGVKVKRVAFVADCGVRAVKND